MSRIYSSRLFCCLTFTHIFAIAGLTAKLRILCKKNGGEFLFVFFKIRHAICNLYDDDLIGLGRIPDDYNWETAVFVTLAVRHLSAHRPCTSEYDTLLTQRDE